MTKRQHPHFGQDVRPCEDHSPATRKWVGPMIIARNMRKPIEKRETEARESNHRFHDIHSIWMNVAPPRSLFSLYT